MQHAAQERFDIGDSYPIFTFSDSLSHNPLSHVLAKGPFSLGFKRSQFSFIDASTRGGAYGSVSVGVHESSGTLMAVKDLNWDTAEENFNAEAEMMLFLREKIEAVRERDSLGGQLSLADRGAWHVAYAYGLGSELVHDDGGHSSKRYLLAMQPLQLTLEEACRGHNSLPPLKALVRVAHDVALALAFFAQHGIVVRIHQYCVRAIYNITITKFITARRYTREKRIISS